MSDTTTEADAGAAEAARVRDEYFRTVDAIKNDNRLSPNGKNEAIQQLAADTNARIDSLRAEHEKAAADERRALEKSVLAPPRLPYGSTASDRIGRDASYRDASDRAGRTSVVDSQELVTLMRRSLRSGDELQSRAALAVALERGNTEAANLYLAELPDGADEANNIRRLWSLMTSENNVEARLREAWKFVNV